MLNLSPLRTFFAAAALCCATTATNAETTHALSMYGDVKYPKNFTHFDYVNPQAPKGGELKLSAIGSFDSFNPFISKGDAAAGLSYLGNSYIWDSLTVRSLDEPFTEYGLLAERMDVADDRSAVTFSCANKPPSPMANPSPPRMSPGPLPP